MTFHLPKILIISRGVWDDNGTSSTLTNIFQHYDSSKVSQIYIETKKPNTNCCSSFFQISEYALVKKLFKWRTKTGQKVDSTYKEDRRITQKEEETFDFVRGHRFFLFTILREFLWLLNGWKSDALKKYIKTENPDVIWITGSPLILMNRLAQYVIKKTNKPYCIFEMDDVYSYKTCNKNPFKYIYRFFLRKKVKSLIKGADQLFVISPKMKKEYDVIFSVNSLVLTKGIDYSNRKFVQKTTNIPINLIYMGQVVYDRLSTIKLLANALKEINKAKEKKIILNIYTTNKIDELTKVEIEHGENVIFNEPVPFSKVQEVIDRNDVVVFVESLNKKFKNIARLSFSTKITDYLSSGKCILAIGPSDIAPMEFFIENDAAIVACEIDKIKEKIELLLQPGVIENYAEKGFNCGKEKFDKSIIENMVFNRLVEIAKN